MLVAIRKRWATTRDQSVPGLFSKHLSNQLERIQHMDKQSAVRKRAVAFTETETEGTSNHTRLDHTSHSTKSSNLFAIFDHLRVRCGYNTAHVLCPRRIRYDAGYADVRHTARHVDIARCTGWCAGSCTGTANGAGRRLLRGASTPRPGALRATLRRLSRPGAGGRVSASADRRPVHEQVPDGAALGALHPDSLRHAAQG